MFKGYHLKSDQSHQEATPVNVWHAEEKAELCGQLKPCPNHSSCPLMAE